MTTRARLRRDLSWPVPAADLQDLDVIEIVHGEDGQVLWRVDDRPAAAPQDCREALMKRRHLDEPADAAVTPGIQFADQALTPPPSGEWPDAAESPFPAIESSEIPELSELPVLSELPAPPEFPELTTLLAVTHTDLPDMPLVLQTPELPDAATALPLRETPDLPDLGVVPQVEAAEDTPDVAELPEFSEIPELAALPELAAVLALTDMPDVPLVLQATERLDGATAPPLRENAEPVDVPVVPQVEAAEDTPDVAELPEFSEIPELAALPELAAVLALTDMPDVPLVLQAAELLDVATALPQHKHADVPTVPQFEAAEDTPQAAQWPELPELPQQAAAHAEVPDPPPVLQAPDVLDMAMALQLRENLEFLDVPVLHVFQAPPDVHALLAAHALPEPHEVPQVAALPPIVELPRATGQPEAREVVLTREWPQVVEFIEATPESEWPPAAEPWAIPEEPAMDAPEIPVLDETHAVPFPGRPHLAAAHMRAWVIAARAALARSRVEPVERFALVGGGMLMGVLFAIVGGPPVPATANVAATESPPHLTRPAPAETGAVGSSTVLQRMVPASRLVKAPVSPFPVTIPAETFPGIGLPVTPSAPRPRPQAAPAVLGAIQRYAVAYNRQDARATKAVWPSADRQALVKTFTGLREQRLTLLSCTTAVTGDSAIASCLGTRRYRPRVGDSSTRIQQGRWRFALQRTGGTWLIASVDAPNG
ncbi:hypothetical protein LuPra_01965 [Luteitalea pratensis]|uniref:Uncharacterized protein n=1 Tax=Luteitalea pratensis TaxID=1855912 RepID=A0A143PKI3_LUTPR|nr:hypothetical protein [Luteitalea pratensis]AMY08760.1 hypothetical protein LuPra_01965 [Luteitalea pratensis]